ncbi:MAG: hypothetical protein P4M11_00945 [Candidatus Pacebacteria bacterium]|nr:hypothetical protein [Candidatus Paceibacterota bacterium]
MHKKHTSLCTKKDEKLAELDGLDQELMEIKASIADSISSYLKHPMYSPPRSEPL